MSAVTLLALDVVLVAVGTSGALLVRAIGRRSEDREPYYRAGRWEPRP